MATQCLHCGSELYAGQRFCRYCGKPSGEFDEEAMPTQAMPQQPGTDPQREHARTAPQYKPDTNPVYTPPQQPQGYQLPVMPPALRPPLYPSAPTRGRSSWGWIIGLVSFGLIGAMVLAVILITSAVRRNRNRSAPPAIAASTRANEKNFGDMGVAGRDISITNRETKIKQSFPLTATSRFSLNIASGDVRVEAWDQPEAEVTVIKRGGSMSERSRSQVFFTDSGGDLAFRFDQSRARGIDVEVQIKLPRTLRQVSLEGASAEMRLAGVSGEVTIKTASGEVELSNVKGAVSVNSQSADLSISNVEGNVTATTQSGAIELSGIKGHIESSTTSGEIDLRDIIGSAKVKSVSGEINAAFTEILAGEPLEFNSTSGEIDLKFNAPVNLDFEAKTISGDIDLDDSLGIPVQKQIPGQQAEGRLGNGGQELTVKTVSGGISVSIEGEQPATNAPAGAASTPESKDQATQKAKGKGN